MSEEEKEERRARLREEAPMVYVFPMAEELQCPICLEWLANPVLTPCAHSFCYHCFQLHSAEQSQVTCPLCKTLLPSLPLPPNRFLLTLLDNQYVYCKHALHYSPSSHRFLPPFPSLHCPPSSFSALLHSLSTTPSSKVPKCTALIKRKDKLAHETHCEFVLEECEHSRLGCEFVGTKEEQRSHHCLYAKLQLPLRSMHFQFAQLFGLLEQQQRQIQSLSTKLLLLSQHDKQLNTPQEDEDAVKAQLITVQLTSPMVEKKQKEEQKEEQKEVSFLSRSLSALQFSVKSITSPSKPPLSSDHHNTFSSSSLHSSNLFTAHKDTVECLLPLPSSSFFISAAWDKLIMVSPILLFLCARNHDALHHPLQHPSSCSSPS